MQKKGKLFSITIFRSKTFVTQIVRFPSAIFLWPALADVVDKSNEEESTTRLLLAHLLEFLVSKEFPNIKYAMKVRKHCLLIFS